MWLWSTDRKPPLTHPDFSHTLRFQKRMSGPTSFPIRPHVRLLAQGARNPKGCTLVWVDGNRQNAPERDEGARHASGQNLPQGPFLCCWRKVDGGGHGRGGYLTGRGQRRKGQGYLIGISLYILGLETTKEKNKGNNFAAFI